MGIEKLTGSLVGEANQGAKEIVKTAQWHVDQMLKDEQSKEDGLKEQASTEVKARLDAQRNERLAWARLEAKRVIAEAREDAITNNLESFFEELKDAHKGTAYKSFLEQSVKQAMKELGGACTIHVSKSDAALLAKLQNCKIAIDLEALGGAIVESEDRTVRIDLRIETLFDIRRDGLRKDVNDRLFGKGKE